MTALTALTTSLLPLLLHPASAGLALPAAFGPVLDKAPPAMAWISEAQTSLSATLPTLALSLALLALLLLLGTGLGRLLGTHQWGIPEALLAGGLGLLVAPAGAWQLIPPEVITLWDQLPLILLTLVFASLLLGKPLPDIGGLWRPLSAQMLVALTLAFGQYLVAALAVLLLLQPLMGAPSVMACLIEVAYEGGHGSAAAMGPTYARLGLESGEALGLALATVGLLASTLVGGLLVLVGRQRGWVRGGAVATLPTAEATGSPTPAPTAVSGAASGAAGPGVAAPPEAAPLCAGPTPSAAASQPAEALQAATALQPGFAAAAHEVTASPGEERGSASGLAPEPDATACKASATSAIPTPTAASGLEPGASGLNQEQPAATITQSAAAVQAAVVLPSAAALQPGSAATAPDAAAFQSVQASGDGVEPQCNQADASTPPDTTATCAEYGAEPASAVGAGVTAAMSSIEPPGASAGASSCGRVVEPSPASAQLTPRGMDGASSPPPFTEASSPPLNPRSFAINLALTGCAVLIGVLMLEALRRLAAWQGGLLAMVVEAFPVFPLALLGSLLMRLLLERTGHTELVLPKLQTRIGTLSADLLITAATACLDLSLLARDWLPLTVLATVGLVWNLAVILLLAPRILPASWFERGLVEFGQATGVAASGLLLLNMVDPDDINGSLTPFSIKQLLLQPFLAGGVITVVAPLAVDGWGLPVWSAVCFALVILWSGLGLWLARSVKAATP